jgi:transcription initiation factor TFIIB
MKEEKEINTPKCPRCGSPNLVTDRETGEVICSECGLMITEKIIDAGPEWTGYQGASRSRASQITSITRPERVTSTTFDEKKNGKGRYIQAEAQQKLKKLKRIDTQSKLNERNVRNLNQALTELDRLSANLHIPRIVKERAAVIYREALENDLIKGRSIDAFVAASLYAAVRLHEIPRRLSEISTSSTRDPSEITHSYAILLRELDLKMPIDDPIKYVSKISSEIGVTQKTYNSTVELLGEAAERKKMVGKNPRGVAAAAVYLACKMNEERCTQKDVAEAAGTSEVTIRKRLKELTELIGDK